jgi:ATP-dependent helicase/nuclease subunit A
MLDYDDLIIQTLRLLEKSDAAEWVLFKLDGGIDRVLIDEAQDTGPEQWAIVRKLTAGFHRRRRARRSSRSHGFRRRRREAVDLQLPGADPAQFAGNRKHFIAQRTPAARC